jgi:hypothetical protein
MKGTLTVILFVIAFVQMTGAAPGNYLIISACSTHLIDDILLLDVKKRSTVGPLMEEGESLIGIVCYSIICIMSNIHT